MLPQSLKQSLLALLDEHSVQQLETGRLTLEAQAALIQIIIEAEHTGCFSPIDDDTYTAQIQEYEAEAIRLEQQLKIIGVSEDQLTAPGLAALKQLAAAAAQLNLAHATNASMTAAWALLVCQDHKTQQMQCKVEHQVAQLKGCLDRAQSAQQELNRALDHERCKIDTKEAEIEAPDEHGLRKRIAVLADKTERFKRGAEKLMGELERHGWKPELAHHRLVQQSADNDKLAAELSQLQLALGSYQDMPPSQVGAELRLRQVQEQLAAVNARLQQGMSNLT